MWLFRLLGPLRAERDGLEVPVGTPQARAVLAMLAWRANEVVSIDRLSDELWGCSPPASSHTQVHAIISRLRRLLGRDRIATARPGYLLRASPPELEIDLFHDEVSRARLLVAADEVESGAGRLRAALARWRGPALAELRSACHAAQGLDEFRVVVLEDRIDADLRLGRGRDLVGELTELVAEHPLRERPRAQLMRALAGAGRVADALRAYAALRGDLVRELGVEPSLELRTLHTRILRGEPVVVRPGDAPRPAARPPRQGQTRSEVTRLRSSGSRLPSNPDATRKISLLNPPAS
ncbi:AfsR/SARP family transcriptional regulator [Actinosynnema sp. NPDC047251]|uniref:OmpR/PhoB-type domain-containing protein n=1 Tax=Saccharothrix espanaensis (strain ATCC 51144 / DSM 44229 / JCM 9112 / NBRC 15066 / NRRL 15764) TaxID=1179773 RepID=K0K124_SACES|nr:AfsR/SARP family transcriptional regulator [Saccharothrix espanaensis]CCH30278.1 hypothetical protein BN6_29680 [Saccharothrix espanaensis DSM 44229]